MPAAKRRKHTHPGPPAAHDVSPANARHEQQSRKRRGSAGLREMRRHAAIHAQVVDAPPGDAAAREVSELPYFAAKQ
jgi:hypothetical protein